MSLLTKLFVLLVAVLTLVLSGVTITLVSSMDNYKQAYESQVDAAKSARSGARQTEENMKHMVATRGTMIQLLHKDNAALMQKNSELQAANNRLLAEKNIAESKVETAIAMTNTYSGTIANMYEGQNIMREDLTSAHADMLTAQKNAIDLTRELSSEVVKYETVKSIYRQREEEMVVLESENVKLRNQLQRVATKENNFLDQSDTVAYQPVNAGRAAIEGEIVAVEQGYASISVGSASGVTQDMHFIVFRDDSGASPVYVGDLTITKVDQSEAAGLLVMKNGSVLPGDSVTTRLAN